MTDGTADPWWVVVAASLPSVLSGTWVAGRWWLERRDGLSETETSRAERLSREMETRRLALSREQTDLFDRLRNELLRCQSRLQALETDHDLGWDLARHWHRRSHELRHAGLNAQAMVAGLCEREEVPVPTWPDMTVVGLEEPLK